MLSKAKYLLYSMLTLILSEVVRGELRRMWKSDGGKRNGDLERRCMAMERKLQ